MIAFEIAARPTTPVRHGSKWAGIISAILATAKDGQAVAVNRAELMADNRRAYNSITRSVNRLAPDGMALKGGTVGDRYFFWLEPAQGKEQA